MTDNIRVNELARELGLTSKEVIEKFAKIQIVVKAHSSSVTPEQVKKLKDFISGGSSVVAKKPKAFIVKKVKTDVPNAEVKPEVIKVEKTEVSEPKEKPKSQSVEKVSPKTEQVSRIERVERVERVEHIEKVERVEKPKVEVVRPRPVENKLEIVRRAPIAKSGDNKVQKSSEIEKSKAKQPAQTAAEDKYKKPIQRHIISQDIYENKGGFRRKDSKSKQKDKISKEEEQERISLEKAAAQKHKKKIHKDEAVAEVKQLVVDKAMTISELSEKLNKTPADIVKFLMLNGVMATVNQLIDVDVIKKVCAEYEIEVLEEDLDAFIEEELEKEHQQERFKVDEKLLKKRAPVVSIMGHVDHGKTTLLDSIRQSKHKIVNDEVGGITQSIGAYTVNLSEGKIVFLDTPGHEAFTEMRARGAKATDIAILVVAADDGIMPQTVEAIAHAKAAEIPIIVAVNKMDKPGADPDRVLTQLTEHGLVPEEWGGDTITCKVSALQKEGIDELLEYILLVADMQDLKANPDAVASGVVIEANLDKGKGPVASLLVQNGTMHVGDCVVVGNTCGKIRALLSDSGERIKNAGPSTPVEILGLTEVPKAGDFFEVVENEREMKAIVDKRKENEREKRLDAMLPAHIRREAMRGEDNIPQLNLIVKANTHGSAEAVSQAIAGLESKKIVTKIIHVGVGDISEADVMLAAASNALILGFTVKEDNNAIIAAERENVTIKKYDIIYQIIEEMENTMLSLLEPETKEVEVGKAEVRQIFTIGKTTRIAGCYVTEGKIARNNIAVVIRNGKEIFKGQIDQLKRFKDDVKEVAQGFECGLSFAKFNDLEEGDIIEVSTTEKVKVSLD